MNDKAEGKSSQVRRLREAIKAEADRNGRSDSTTEADEAAARALRLQLREQQKADIERKRNELYAWNAELEKRFRESGVDHHGAAQKGV